MNSPESVSRIVTRFDRLSQLKAKAQQLGALNALLVAGLPHPLSSHVTLATIRDGCLVFQADNAAWAAKLRYKAPEILAGLAGKPEFSEIRSIRVRNSIPSAPHIPPITRPTLSRQSAEAIVAQAGSITDENVRQALLRLSRRGGK